MRKLVLIDIEPNVPTRRRRIRRVQQEAERPAPQPQEVAVRIAIRQLSTLVEYALDALRVAPSQFGSIRDALQQLESDMAKY